MTASETRLLFDKLKCCVVIPTYNNQGTLQDVINDVKQYTGNLMVVNDGSTDSTSEILEQNKECHIVQYTPNRGKGYAIKKAFKKAFLLGYDYVITIDADGQHYASDLITLAEKLKETPDTILIGSRGLKHKNMASGSTFANKFSNFWVLIETGTKLPDTQSGYRLYPIWKMKSIRFFSTRYEFEIEILVRCLWRGIKIVPVPVSVYYSPKELRVSHFRPSRDFMRISVLNTLLVPLAIVYGLPSVLIHKLLSLNKKV